MSGIKHHILWASLCGAALLWLGLGLPQLTLKAETMAAAVTTQQEANAQALAELHALQQDAAEAAQLQNQLGINSYQALSATLPRAQLVASLRQYGLEAGLHDFSLTLDPAAQSSMTAHNPIMTTTSMIIKASAPNDHALYQFLSRALAEQPAALQLEKMQLRRETAALTAPRPDLVQAEFTLRWLALSDDALFVREQK